MKVPIFSKTLIDANVFKVVQYIVIVVNRNGALITFFVGLFYKLDSKFTLRIDLKLSELYGSSSIILSSILSDISQFWLRCRIWQRLTLFLQLKWVGRRFVKNSKEIINYMMSLIKSNLNKLFSHTLTWISLFSLASSK